MAEIIPTFLSVGEPHKENQREYLKIIGEYLNRNGIAAETLGRSFWSIENPLRPVQRKMQKVYGAVILAMERYYCNEVKYKEGSASERLVKDQYYASVWTHIEAAMAYQLELPLLILKEEKLVSEGMFDPGIHEWMVIRINPEESEELERDPIKGFIDSWIEAVRRCYYVRTSK